MSLGADKLYGPEDTNHVKVSDIKIHPEFNPITNKSFAYDNDFAILTLEEPVTFNEKIQQVCLPKDTEPILEGRGWEVRTTGWGGYNPGNFSSQPRSLQVALLLINSHRRCEVSHWFSGHSYVTNDRKICADLDDDKYDPCKVDSGGPLIITGNEQ